MNTIPTRWEEDLRYKLLTILGWKIVVIGCKTPLTHWWVIACCLGLEALKVLSSAKTL
jgi:hypothetical protein